MNAPSDQLRSPWPALRRAGARGIAPLALLWMAGCGDSVGPDPASCSGPALDLAVGEIAEPAELVGDGVCLDPSSPAELVVVPVVTSAGSALVRHDVDILGEGFDPGDPNVVARDPSAAAVSARPWSGIEGGWRWPAPGEGSQGAGPIEPVDSRIRRLEEAELGPRLRARRVVGGGPAWTYGAVPSAGADPPASRAGAPSVGSMVEYNTAVSCEGAPNRRAGRVVAVTERTVVVADTAAEGAGYSDADLSGFGRFFDEVVGPTLDGAFGGATDVDGNGRVVLFFTPASNALAPPGTVGVVGGYFWGGDLFPADDGGGTGLEPCPASSEAEILYLSVPDPDGRFGNPIGADRLYTRATIAHEYQHLVNAARRIYVNEAPVLEEAWLNEGLSYIAEELVFYRSSGLAPGGNLDGGGLAQAGAVEAFNDFVFNSVGRYNVFLLGPHTHSLRGLDGVETRGAAWSFLRYVLDRTPRDPGEVLFALLNGTGRGLDNLSSAAGIDPHEWMADWAVSLVADDVVGSPPARFRQPSWNLPTIIRDTRTDGRYPLAVIPVPPTQGLRFQLRSGGAGFGGIRLTAGARASLRVATPDPSARVRAFLVRVR